MFNVCVWEGAGDRRETSIFCLPLLWPSVLCLSCSPDAQPEALVSTLLGAVFLYCILSATSLVPKLHRGSRGPPRPSVAFPTTSASNWNSKSTVWLVSWLSYKIVQRPLDRPLDLWNRMFNQHQAEITVMQFRGHALPLCQSMRVSWNFLACPILLANFCPRDFLS